MLIEWTKKNYHHIAFRPAVKDGETYNVHGVKELDLIFGINYVPDADWTECKKSVKSVVQFLKDRVIKERGSEDISKLDEPQAIALVKDCFAVTLLKGWARDVRAKVADAAQAQLDEIDDAMHGGRKNKKNQDQAEA